MPRFIPTAGYPSRTEAILAMNGQGLRAFEIAKRIGIKANVVRVVLCHARTGRASRSAVERTIVVSVDILERLQMDADARMMSVNKLVRMLLDRIADDNLVAAILDDEGETNDAC